MPMSTMIILVAIVSPFLLFAVVLAWGEYQTRSPLLRPPTVDHKCSPAEATVQPGAGAGETSQRSRQLETV